MFGSVARGERDDISDIDFLVENASAFGVGADQYEVQQLLGIIPTFALPKVEDRSFVKSVQIEVVALWCLSTSIW